MKFFKSLRIRSRIVLSAVRRGLSKYTTSKAGRELGRPVWSQCTRSRRITSMVGEGERPPAISLRLSRQTDAVLGSFSTAHTLLTPRSIASQPITPLPLQRSSQEASCSSEASMFMTASRTRAVVGLVLIPTGLRRRRPPLRRSRPLTASRERLAAAIPAIATANADL